MRQFFIVVCALVVAMGTTMTAQTRRGSLYGWVVVVDAGHGGMDPGASGVFQGKRVVEDEYVFDVALRVRRMIQARGGLAIMTTVDNIGERNWVPFKVFPDERTERFTTDGTIVGAGTGGLRRRLRLGNQIKQKYSRHRQVWISVHFDVRGRGGDDGVRIIAADTELQIAKSLERSFGNAKRLRDDDPVVESGDRDHGIRRLFILSGENRIKEKVLIELGNFRNEADVWRIRNHVVREAYAKAIVDSLVGW